MTPVRPTVSLQLYTVNAALEPDLDAGVARLAAIGFDTVEAFAFVDRAPQLKQAFDAHGISAKTGHAFLVEESVPLPDGTVMTAPSHADTFAAAQVLGIEIVIDPFVGPAAWTTREGVERVAARLNAAAEEAAAHGMRVGYHNHDHELRPHIDGKPALQVLAELLDPASCSSSTCTGRPPPASTWSRSSRSSGTASSPCTSRTAPCATASPPRRSRPTRPGRPG